MEDGYFAAVEIIHLRFLECVFVVSAVHLSLDTTASGGSPYSHLQEEGPAV